MLIKVNMPRRNEKCMKMKKNQFKEMVHKYHRQYKVVMETVRSLY